MGTLSLAFLAGLLSILSPCVLPLLPMILGAASTQGRLGPVFLALGLTVSFVGIGIFVALFGFAIGLDQDVFRSIAAMLLIAVGLVLALPPLQARFAVAAGPVSGWVDQKWGRTEDTAAWNGYSGQFGFGVLLGAIWAPCVGPTLGAASLLASRGENLGHVALTMGVFGIGAAIPLLALGLVSREVMLKLRNRMLSAGQTARMMLGALLVVTGLAVLFGFDKRLEATLVDISPDWLTQLTTQF